MSFKDFREESRTRWGSSQTDKISTEQITLGCILRIADAVETIAVDRVNLEKDLAYYKEQYSRQRNTIDDLNKKVIGMTSARTRYKNQIEKLKNQLK